MKAHPEFRWYNKMPAVTSSSRGMSTRTKPARLLVAHDSTQQQQIIPGKLADESQLGGLSILLSQACTKPIAVYNQTVPKPPKKRYLEENYIDQDGHVQNQYNTSESSGCSSPVENRELPLTNGNITFKEDRKDIVEEEEEDKVAGEGEERNRLRIWRKHLLVNESGGNDEKRRKEEMEQEVNNNNQGSGERKGRACKGQRYKEFMNTLQATLPRKKSKWETNDDIPEDKVQTRRRRDKSVETKKIKEEPLDLLQTSPDFNLDEKIHALPSLNIEEFQIKKKAKKKGCGTGRKEESWSRSKGSFENATQTQAIFMHDLKVQLERQNNNNNIVNEDSSSIFCGLDCAIGGNEKKDEDKCVVVGSRKRKARRQGIRRLQPGTSFKDTSVVEVANDDTLGLETLADVAAKKQKLVK